MISDDPRPTTLPTEPKPDIIQIDPPSTTQNT
jgi:hypothetical protein